MITLLKKGEQRMREEIARTFNFRERRKKKKKEDRIFYSDKLRLYFVGSEGDSAPGEESCALIRDAPNQPGLLPCAAGEGGKNRTHQGTT